MNEATQTGVAMATIAMIATVVGAVVGYFKDRDKLRYDAEFSSLKHQNAGQAVQIATLAATQKHCEEKHRDCEEKQNAVETRLADIEKLIRNAAHKTTPA